MTSAPSSSLFNVYAEALAWLRQMHAMCACADTTFPLPLPPMASPEPAYYVTKMATGVPPMQPFDPRWASCPSPSTAPCVDRPGSRDPPSRSGQVSGRGRDFSIPSILSRAGSSSTGADSDDTTESEERCRSTSSSVDDIVCGTEQRHIMTSQHHVVTSCDDVRRAPVDLMSHQRRRQHDKQQYECTHCNKVYSTMGALKMHVRTHTLPCRCPVCGKAFSRPWLLQGHLRTHTGERPFQCQHCDRAFADRSNLRAHLQTHAGVKRYHCHVCNKPFSRMSLLAKHHEASCRSN